MAASSSALAGRDHFDLSIVRRITGLAIACALAVSCSAATSDATLGFTPETVEDAMPAQDMASAEPESGESAATPSPRPRSDEQALKAEAETAAGPAPETAAVEADDGAAAPESGEQALAHSAPAEESEPAAKANRKSALFAGLFAPAGSEAASPKAEPAATAEASPAGIGIDPKGADTALGPAKPSPEEDPAPGAAKQEAAEESEPVRLARAEPSTAAEGEKAEQAAAGRRAGADQPQKRGLLSAFFAPAENKVPFPDDETRQSPQEAAMETSEDDGEPEKPVVLASATPAEQAAMFSGDALPGVREREQLFEIKSASSVEDISNVDLYEDVDGGYEVASAAGLARLAPNGLIRQREDVDVTCLKPELVRLLKTVERRFGKRIVVTSGYRSPAHNRRVNGARNSMHMYCKAADIQVEGVSKWELARFVRDLPGRGGVGTYCHTRSVHVDVGPERDWNWRCRRRR